MTHVTMVIPARGGSKGVPAKNLRRVGGSSLVGRAVRSCLDAALADVVVVSTDDAGIAAEAERSGARVVRRPADIAGDAATSESAVVHALDVLDEDGVSTDVAVLVQCTSPFIAADDLDAAIERVARGDADVIFSAIETHEFLWRSTDKGCEGVNHDHSFRPRRQDREPHYRETGAFYVMRAAGLRLASYRFFGRVEHHAVPAAHAIEIDTMEELALADTLAPVYDAPAPIDVDAVITDFDGVHTDDRAYIDQDGHESVSVSRSDGMGIAILLRAGIRILVLSTESNPVVTARARKLGVEVRQGAADNKAMVLKTWLDEHGIDPARAAYVGNDVNDIDCLGMVGWPVVVPDAHPAARAQARVVLSRPGGAGAIRDLCERVIATRGNTAWHNTVMEQCSSDSVWSVPDALSISSARSASTTTATSTSHASSST